jgi:hypothetical protein
MMSPKLNARQTPYFPLTVSLVTLHIINRREKGNVSYIIKPELNMKGEGKGTGRRPGSKKSAAFYIPMSRPYMFQCSEKDNKNAPSLRPIPMSLSQPRESTLPTYRLKGRKDLILKRNQ